MKKILSVLVVLFLFTVSCKGDGSRYEGSSNDQQQSSQDQLGTEQDTDLDQDQQVVPPAISSVTPSDNATGVEINAQIKVVFSKAMDATSINTDTFTVKNSGNSVSGTVTYAEDTNTATFAPSKTMALLAKYTATISTGVKDSEGNAMAEDYNWNFIIRDGTWGTPKQVSQVGALNAEYAQVGLDSKGDAIVVWQQSDNWRNNIQARHYTATDKSWGVIKRIETGDATAKDPHIAMAPNGNAVAVWMQIYGSKESVLANYYTPATGWGTAMPIERNDDFNALSPIQVAIDDSGNAMAVWYQSDGMQNSIWANRYNFANSSWGADQLIERINSLALLPQIGVDPKGNAIAVWAQKDATEYSIWANRYDSTSDSWNTAAKIEASDAYASSPHIAVDREGNAIANWNQVEGSNHTIWVNRYISENNSWGTPTLIVSGASYSRIAVDSSGNAVAISLQEDGVNHSIVAKHYSSADDRWSEAVTIQSSTNVIYLPQVAADANGNVIVVWHQAEGALKNIWANRYDAAHGNWGTAMKIETSDTDAVYPKIAIDSNGAAMAVWDECTGSGGTLHCEIWSNRFE